MTPGAHVVDAYPARLLRWAAAAVLVTGMHVGGAALALLHWHGEELLQESAGSVAIELAPVALAPPVEQTNLAHGPPMEEATPAAPAESQPAEKLEKETKLPKAEPSPLAPEPEVALPVQTPAENTKPVERSQEPVPRQQASEQPASAPLASAPPHVAAQAAPTPAAPVTGTSAIPASIRASWQKALLSHLNRFKRYPQSARARGIQGIVQIEFTIDREGRIVASHVARSSGSPALDAEALATLRRADPLPAPPVRTADTLNLILPVHFRMR